MCWNWNIAKIKTGGEKILFVADVLAFLELYILILTINLHNFITKL